MVNVGIQLIVYIFQSTLFHCLNTNIYSYLETSGGTSSDLYLNVVHFFNTSIWNLLQLNTVVFLHWCLMHAVILIKQSPISIWYKILSNYLWHWILWNAYFAHIFILLLNFAWVRAGNTKGVSITVPLTSCLTCLD